MEEESIKQVVVGYYMSPDGQMVPLMADAKYYPNGVPASPFLTPQTGNPIPVRQGTIPVPQQSQMPMRQQSMIPAAQYPQSSVPPIPSGAPQTQAVRSVLPPSLPKKQERNLENVVGRNLMGILASILIFIGMILFATVAYESFSKAARVFCLYAASGVLLTVGLVGMRKNRNAFFLSLAGCGAGAVYISLFLTYGYFELINGMLLYLLLGIWSFIVFFLGGKGSLLFKTIGQSGVLISACYGTIMQLMERKTPALLSFTLVLMVYYIVVTVFYLLMDHTPGYKANLPFLCMDFFGAVVLMLAACNIRRQIEFPVQIALAVVILAYTLFLLFLYRQRILYKEMTADASAGWAISVFVQSAFAALTFADLIIDHSQWIRGCVAMLQFGALWWLTEHKTRKDAGRVVSLAVIYLFLWIFSGSLGVLSDILGIGLFALIFLTMGYFKRDKLYFLFGCVSSFIYILFYNAGNYTAIYSLFSVLFVLLILFFLLYGDRIYHAEFKVASYVMLQIFLFRLGHTLAEYTIFSTAVWINVVYLVSAVLCIAATQSPFCNDWLGNNRKETCTQIALGVLNIILMLWSFPVLEMKNGEIFHVLTLLAFLALCSQNIMPMVRHYGNSLGVGVYTGFKLTLFLQAALYSYQTESYVVSLACLFLALAFITFGFFRNYKPIRLYGLLLSLYSIFKLVIVDVTYHSTLSRALTILGCGVLAFVISFVYNKISRKLDEAEAVTKEMPEEETVTEQMVTEKLVTDEIATEKSVTEKTAVEEIEESEIEKKQ